MQNALSGYNVKTKTHLTKHIFLEIVRISGHPPRASSVEHLSYHDIHSLLL